MENFKFILKIVGSIFSLGCCVLEHRKYCKAKDKLDKLDCKISMCFDYLVFTFIMLV